MEPLGCEQNEQITELMSMALDNLLGADDERRLQQHLVTCQHCQAAWDGMKRASELLEQSSMMGPPLGFAVRVERRLNEKSKNRRRVFGGVAVLTSSLSLAGVTAAAVAMIVFGVIAWRSVAPSELQLGTMAVSQVASGMGLVGKAASLFLMDILIHYGPPVIVFVGIGLVVLAGIWAWLFTKRPGNIHRNGYV